MRQIHSARAYNKIFHFGELTVEDYLLFMTDEREAFFKVLKEFNPTIPRLNKYHQEKFIQILFHMTDDETQKAQHISDEKKKKLQAKNQALIEDFHIFVGMLAVRIPAYSYSDIMKMPKRRFEKTFEDLNIIVGNEEYDKNRNLKSPDLKKFKEVTGGKSTLSHQ